MRKYDINFWEVYWGPDDAKGDDKLNTYFVKIPQYENIKTGDYRYIIGRKGTGKTAIIEQLISEADSKHDHLYKYLSLKNFPIQSLRGLKDKSHGDKSQYVPIWTFLILTEICKLIMHDETVQPYEAKADIAKFITKNFPSGLGFQETVKILTNSENKVSLLGKWMGIEDRSSVGDEIEVPVHFQKATEILSNIISSISSQCQYYLFFDELDEGYSVNDKGLSLLLLALFRAVENTYLELKKTIKFRPVLAMRSDIFERLEDNDLNKLDDYVINLKWTTESMSSYSLYELVNARITASLDVQNPTDAWNCITDNLDPTIPPSIKSLWKCIYNRTFERPRDIVKYLKICSKIQSSGILRYSHVRNAEIDYSDWFFREFRDEIQSHLRIWQECSQAIIKLSKGIFTVNEIVSEFKKDKAINNYISNSNESYESILEKLFDFGLIGNLNPSGKWFFKYKDANLPFNSDNLLILHFGFSRKFRIKAY